MAEERSRSAMVAAVVVGVGLIAAAAWLWTRASGHLDEMDRERPAVAAAPPATAAEPTPADPVRAPSGPAESEAPAGDDPLAALDASAAAWAKVDMEAVRAAMPGNLYWTMSMPTRDAAVLAEREEIRERWNREYGKVLSNTATEREVRDYYAHRQRLSADYVEFTSHLLERYGDVLPERDVGLLELARELHLARLEEIPRNLADALERREAHARVREAWLAEQALFAGRPAADGDAEPAASEGSEADPAPQEDAR